MCVSPSTIHSSGPLSKHLPDDWLERMYHSCQHRRPPVPESHDHPELHPLLMSHLVGGVVGPWTAAGVSALSCNHLSFMIDLGG